MEAEDGELYRLEKRNGRRVFTTPRRELGQEVEGRVKNRQRLCSFLDVFAESRLTAGFLECCQIGDITERRVSTL